MHEDEPKEVQEDKIVLSYRQDAAGLWRWRLTNTKTNKSFAASLFGFKTTELAQANAELTANTLLALLTE